MSSLAKRFPGARRVVIGSGDAEISLEQLLAGLAPYFDWQLVEMDDVTSDILLYRPGLDPQQPSEFVILGGKEAQAWLRHRPANS